ncbi:transposase [Nitratiruptor tergarcus]|uniref:transposase n=1 Tax=Nitratiruptor tergarcus TaxID=269259 RepID=UPI0039E189D5
MRRCRYFISRTAICFTDLNNRGVEDILIASVDCLKGFPEVIHAIFTKQKCNYALFSVRAK